MGKKRIKLIDLDSEEEAGGKTRPEKKAVEEAVQLRPEKKEKKEKIKAKKAKLRSKRYLSLAKQVDRNKAYSPQEAVKLLLSTAKAGFDESVELNLNLKNDQVSGSVKLPHGTGKTKQMEIKFKSQKKAPLLQVVIGKVSLGEKKLLENLESFLAALEEQQLKKITLSSSMGPGIKISTA